SELDGPDLKQYFRSEAEKKALVDRILSVVNSSIFGSAGVTNDSAREAVVYIGNQLIGSIAEKVWKSEGVNDEARMKPWRKRILEPMNRCFQATETYTEAQSCIEAVKKDVISNIGMVLAYELTRQEIAPRSEKLREQLPEAARTTFWSCRVQKGGAVDACVLSGVRSAIRSVADETLARIMQESKFSPKLQGSVKSTHLPVFDRCLSSAKNKAEILVCSDKLTQFAGSEISYHMVQQRLSGMDSVPKKKRAEISSFARDEFRSCFGTLKNTDTCGKIVTNKVIRNVVESEFESAATGRLEPAAIAEPLALAKSELQRCWDDRAPPAQRESCLRRGVKALTLAITQEILRKEATPAAKNDHPGFVEKFLGDLTGCLEKRIPANISEAKNLEAGIGECTGPLTREAAMLIARSEVRASLSGNLPAVEVDRVIERRVDGVFATCLGTSPDSPRLADCAFQLKTDVARLAPRKIFQREMDKLAGNHPEFFQSREMRDGLEKIYSLHAACINRTADPNNAKKTDKAIDACLRESVERFALFAAKVELGIQAKDVSDSARPRLVDDLLQVLGTCLRNANRAATSLTGFTASLDGCTLELRKTATYKIGSTLSSEEAIRQTGSDEAVRPHQRSLHLCLQEEGLTEKDMASCVDTFQVQAMRDIVSAAVRKEVISQLGSFEPFLDMEQRYFRCMYDAPREKLRESLDSCTRDHVLDVALAVGTR
ncbi:MAG: hypothetical protein HUU37_10090, partial [Bdellovibrionales bacterium]|nr:hypothetical protein [Bdellovibrionales bacterium]